MEYSKNWGRSTRNWKELCKRVRTEQAAVCWLCGKPIALTLHHYDKWAFTVDHKKSRETHPELAETYSNLAPSHKSCNSRKGVGLPQYEVKGSRVW